ncbi:MAG: phage shock protein PspA [Alphaproteobacteria bacterium]
MGIFSRLTDIVNSNINALLDRAEEPEKMIRLIIAEMEDTLVEVRSTAARTIAEKKDLQRTVERVGAAQAEWEKKAELAISRDREDLAKAALVEKAKLGETATAIEEELGHLEVALDRNDVDVAKLESKLNEAKARQKALLARHDTANARLKVRRKLHDGRVDDAFMRFDVVEKRLARVEGEIESYDLGQKQTLAEEIDSLAAESAIEEELAAIKARISGQSQGASKKG